MGGERLTFLPSRPDVFRKGPGNRRPVYMGNRSFYPKTSVSYPRQGNLSVDLRTVRHLIVNMILVSIVVRVLFHTVRQMYRGTVKVVGTLRPFH